MLSSLRLLLTPPLTRYREHKYDRYRNLRDWQWMDKSKLQQLQRQRLTTLLIHARKTVPYYRELLSRHSVLDGETVDIESFRQLPILDKPTIRNEWEALQTEKLDSREWYENTSGGSTGKPVRFIQDTEYDQWNFAIKKIFNDWTGYYHLGPEIKLWGSEEDILNRNTTTELPDGFREKLSLWFGGRHTQNAFQMSRDDMFRFVEEINELRPIQIKAYTESIYQLANFIEREELAVYSPNSILVTAGNLHEHMRDQIEETFQSEVFDQYGSREVGAVACECEYHDGLHVSAPTHYVEILDEEGNPTDPGEVGDVVVTTLTNYAMPLIRYRIGDRAAWADWECGCGRSWPLLEEITGRVSDTFVAKDGTQVHGEYFTHLFYFRDWVQKFQVVQEEYDYIRISIVPVEYTAKTNHHQMYREGLNEVTEDIREVMGKECEVVFEFAYEISPTDSGKYRYTISKVTT